MNKKMKSSKAYTTSENLGDFDLRSLAANIMVHMVNPVRLRSIAAF